MTYGRTGEGATAKMPCGRGLGFTVGDLDFRGYEPAVMQNQMEKDMENEVEAGIIQWLVIVSQNTETSI